MRKCSTFAEFLIVLALFLAAFSRKASFGCVFLELFGWGIGWTGVLPRLLFEGIKHCSGDGVWALKYRRPYTRSQVGRRGRGSGLPRSST